MGATEANRAYAAGMTEPSLQDLFTGIHAHHKDFVSKSGELAGIAAAIREADVGVSDEIVHRIETIAQQMGLGLDRLNKLADAAQAETAMDLKIDEVAAAASGTCPVCGRPVPP